jgi:hypothetical protein
LIGETLFLLRSMPGFAEFCRQMEARDLRSTYFEIYAARMFLEGGYEVRARPEVGTRGEDFDFQAARGHETINVEVTALTAPTFSPQTILNALHQKRKQLPGIESAIVFCVLPENWGSTDRLDFHLFNCARSFFGKTRRVAAVVFVTEKHVDFEPGGPVGYLSLDHLCFWHPAPRRRIVSADFLLNDWETGAAPDDLPTQRRENEFFRWADSLFMVGHQGAD